MPEKIPQQFSVLCVTLVFAVIAACAASPKLDKALIVNALESAPVPINGTVSIPADRLSCVLRSDLWVPEQAPGGTIHGGRAAKTGTARLVDAGRTLGFRQDLLIQDSTSEITVAVEGEQHLKLLEILSIRHGGRPATTFVETRVAIKLEHECFPEPIPLSGTQTVSLEFQLVNGKWRMERILP